MNVEELIRLPEVERFYTVQVTRDDGTTVNYPVAEPLMCCFVSDEDEPIWWFEGEHCYMKAMTTKGLRKMKQEPI